MPLAREGRVVVIPNPFIWYPESKKVIKEISEKSPISIATLGMLNMLSICHYCNLHPYTIAESKESYDAILNHQIPHVDAIGRDAGTFAYEGILGALLTDRLLEEVEFNFINNYPIYDYVKIISQNRAFYSEYLNCITAGGSLNADLNIANIKDAFLKTIESRNSSISNKVVKGLTVASGIGSASIAIVATTVAVSAPIAITGGILGLSASLGALMKDRKSDENIIVNLFCELRE